MPHHNLTEKEQEALRLVRNWLVHKGHSPSIRVLAKELGYRSPRSAALVIDALIEREIIKRRPNGDLQILKDPMPQKDHARTINIPLVGTAPAGPLMLAEEHIEAMIPVSTKLAKPGHKYFLLRIVGDSMNEVGINDGGIVLVRQQPVAENNEIVVALIDGMATIKEFHRTKDVIILKPRSKNKNNQPIILDDDFTIQGVVVLGDLNIEKNRP